MSSVKGTSDKAAVARRRSNSLNSSKVGSSVIDNEADTTKKRKKKSECPCTRSSEGTDWLLTCRSCKQNWHNSCANLKGLSKATKSVVDSVSKLWDCPWCFTCIIPPPSGISSKAQLLQNTTISDQISSNITSFLSERLGDTRLVKPDFDGIQAQLSDLSTNVQELLVNNPLSTTQPTFCVTKPVPKVVSNCPEKPYEKHLNDFLTKEEISKVIDHLGYLKDSGDLVKEKGHSVKQYGVLYPYPGSRSNDTEEIPAIFEGIIDRMQGPTGAPAPVPAPAKITTPGPSRPRPKFRN